MLMSYDNSLSFNLDLSMYKVVRLAPTGRSLAVPSVVSRDMVELDGVNAS